MRIYRIADIKELTEEVQQMEEMKKDLNPQDLKEFEKGIEEQMKSMTPEQRKQIYLMLDENNNNPNLPGTPNNTTMPTTKNLQQKPKDKYDSPPNNLSREQRSVFSPTEMLFKSKFPEMKPDIRDQKGKVVMNDLFNSLTDGNKAELTKHLNQMRPVLKKYREKEDAMEKKRNMEKK